MGETFKRWLGTFCNNLHLCSLTPAYWTHISHEYKEKRWSIDQRYVKPPDQKNWAMKLLGEVKRNRRTKMKKELVKPNMTKEDVLRNIPAWTSNEQFNLLVDYWFYGKTPAKSRRMPVECAVLYEKVFSTKEGVPVTVRVGENMQG